MPSAFSHAVVGSSLVWCGLPGARPGLIVLGAALAVAPDLDVAGLAVGWGLDHPLGHRGLSHSLVTAAVIAAVATAWCRRWPPVGGATRPNAGRVWLLLMLAAASHGVLDAFTNGGRGVAFFAPLSARRWHFGVRPIEVSPIGVGEFFSARGLEVMENEVAWIWLPAIAILLLVWGLRVNGRRTRADRAPDR